MPIGSGDRNAVIVLLGKKGAGKSYKLRELVGPCRRLLVADVEASWDLRPGDEVCEGAPALLERIEHSNALDPAVPFRWIYRDAASRMALTAPGAAFVLRNCTLVIDELAWLCRRPPAPLPPYVERLLQFGRKRRVNLLGTTREPQEIPDLFYPTADLLYFFRVDPGNGLDRVRQRYRDLAGELPTLPDRAFRTYGNPDVLALLGREGLDLASVRRQPRQRTKRRR
jgi:hypothetical protein